MHTQARQVYAYTKKGFFCGDILEEYTYEKPVLVGEPSISQYFEKKNRVPRDRTDFSIARTRKQIRRLVNSNPTMDKFLTLTFAENVTDLKQANYEFKKFKQKLERKIGSGLKYIAVPEFQQRGAVHYHLMLDMPYLHWKELSALWGHGRIQIEQIRKRGRAGAYLSKYLRKAEKDNGEAKFDVRYYCQKAYFFSRGLLEKSVQLVDNFLLLAKSTYSKIKLMQEYQYSSMVHGNVTIRYYLLN